MSRPLVHHISSSVIKPWRRMLVEGEEAEVCHLTPWDLGVLSAGYGQVGFLFKTTTTSSSSSSSSSNNGINPTIHSLKTSLSIALSHFYPLAGRLSIQAVNHPSPSLTVSINCNHAGAQFIHAVAPDTTFAQVLSPTIGPPTVLTLFPLGGAVNFDGHSLPLVVVQATEVEGGLFLACSLNHVVVDGTSFFHFVRSWFEIAASGNTNIRSPPIIQRWFPDGVPPPIPLPFKDPSEFIERYSPPRPLCDRIFHFSRESILRLKSMAMHDSKSNKNSNISSFQVLVAHVWISITRARGLPAGEKTNLRVVVDNRTRLLPTLPENHLGCCVEGVYTRSTAGELVASSHGRVARMVNESMERHTDRAVRMGYQTWAEKPVIRHWSSLGRGDVNVNGSPRFETAVSGWSLGEVAAYRTGPDNKCDGLVTAAAGTEEKGSIDLEICLLPEVMSILESDKNFMYTDMVSKI